MGGENYQRLTLCTLIQSMERIIASFMPQKMKNEQQMGLGFLI